MSIKYILINILNQVIKISEYNLSENYVNIIYLYDVK
jgi:hypothetical protein